jgi:hypothetical protein
MPPMGPAHALGDGRYDLDGAGRCTSDDLNWYSKRAILSGVYSSTVLYWLGDQSAGHAATWAFLDRRIEDVMRFETLKKAAEGESCAGAADGGAGLAGQAGARALGQTAGRPAGTLARLEPEGGCFPRGIRQGKHVFSGSDLTGNSAHALAERARTRHAMRSNSTKGRPP